MGSAFSLAVKLPNRPSRDAGLIRLHTHVIPRAGAPARADLALRYRIASADGSASECLTRPLAWGAAPTALDALALNTHALPNGPATGVCELLDAAGTVLAEAGFTLQVANCTPLARQVAANVQRRQLPVLLAGDCDASRLADDDPALAPWFDRPDALAQVAAWQAGGRVTAQEAGCLQQFVRDGYFTLEGVLEESLLAAVNRDIDQAVAEQFDGYRPGSSQRMRGLQYHSAAVRQLWTHPVILQWLQRLFGEPATPCGNLVFEYGSQQAAHQDTIHLTPFPAGYMCGVWVALEDVVEGSGELVVYPGSHRLPRIYRHTVGCPVVHDNQWDTFNATVKTRWEAMLAGYSEAPVYYRPKKGAVLIWHENLMHGGSRRLQRELTRRSIVSHYFADGALAYYDSTGLPAYQLYS